MKKLTRTLTALAATALLGQALPAQAQIQEINTGTSGNQISSFGGGDASASFSYDNTGGEYLALVVVATSANGLTIPTTGIEATFDGDDFSLISQVNPVNQSNYWVGIYGMAAPTDGSGTVSFDFNAAISDGSSASGDAAWQFGVVSLTGVDETDPVAFIGDMGQTGGTFSDPEITAGDFFLMGHGAFNSIGIPNFQTPTDGAVSLFALNGADGLRSYQAEYAELGVGDVTGNSITFTSNGTTRNSAVRPFVIFNSEVVVPEPTSAALLIGSIGLLALRRRRRG